ncbi:hypothetical protein E2C01_016326 [Portunus trituberculatus]|uniref:Uncharacterized protein n=1 Tax=Portunus trituberculatus TaxID=210409 RepID=A0A5B7DPZ2_PORTR|nr:hypothetical protein [Portunus trituberculatus]
MALAGDVTGAGVATVCRNWGASPGGRRDGKVAGRLGWLADPKVRAAGRVGRLAGLEDCEGELEGLKGLKGLFAGFGEELGGLEGLYGVFPGLEGELEGLEEL